MKRKKEDSARRHSQLKQLSEKMGIAFEDVSLLHKALTHTSYANEFKMYTVEHNERLEFLGDAILDAVISDELFRRYPSLPEGELTKARAAIVCEGSLADSAHTIGIGQYLLLGRGENASGGRERASILADAFEAIIGAIYIDSGLENCRKFVLKYLGTNLEKINFGHYSRDYKTLLQEVVQKKPDQHIQYSLLNETGPDHNKEFTISVAINDVTFGIGIGKSKKDAEQKAARQALTKLGNE